MVSGYARRIITTDIKWDILKTCIMFYNGLRFHVEQPTISLNEDDAEKQCHPLSWSNCDATTYQLRVGPNYVDGQKAQSAPAMYTIFRMDCYKVTQKMNGFWKYVHPDLSASFCDEVAAYSLPSGSPHPLPPLLIINMMVPTYKAEMGGKTVDGPGYSLLVTCHLSQLLHDQLSALSQDPSAKVDGLQLNAVKLALNFMKSDDSVTDKVRERMKVITRIINPKKAGFGFVVGKMIKKYNGKPFLARTSTSFYYEEGLYFGVDVDMSLWSYAARKGLNSIWDQVVNSIYDVAFVVEGRANHELPEQMICCARLSKLGLNDVAMEPPENVLQLHRDRMQREKEEKEAAQKEAAQQIEE